MRIYAFLLGILLFLALSVPSFAYVDENLDSRAMIWANFDSDVNTTIEIIEKFETDELGIFRVLEDTIGFGPDYLEISTISSLNGEEFEWKAIGYFNFLPYIQGRVIKNDSVAWNDWAGGIGFTYNENNIDSFLGAYWISGGDYSIHMDASYDWKVTPYIDLDYFYEQKNLDGEVGFLINTNYDLDLGIRYKNINDSDYWGIGIQKQL